MNDDVMKEWDEVYEDEFQATKLVVSTQTSAVKSSESMKPTIA